MAVRDIWTAERIARLLPKAKKTPTGWKACCPAHEDHNPSLFIADGADGIAMRCYAGCSYRDIVAALESKGAEFGDPVDADGYPTSHYQLGEPHHKWEYRDATGRVIMLVCRWNQPGGRKDIRPLIRTSDGWKWQHHPTPRPLYNLDQLTNEPERPVYVVEGEKAAAAGQRLFPKVVVTTWPGGAQSVGQADWSVLAGRDVTLIPDCDKPGLQAMQWVAKAISSSALRVRIVDPREFEPGLPEGWDLADALDAKAEIAPWFVERAPTEKKRRIRSLVEILENPTTPVWLLDETIEASVIALMSGPRGTYKSFIALHWAMQIAMARQPVLIVSAEGSGLDRRMDAWLRHCAPSEDRAAIPIYAIEQRVNFYDRDAAVSVVSELCELAIKPSLIVIDTLSKNSGPMDESNNAEAKVFVGILDEYVRGPLKCAILIVHHTGHTEKGRARGASTLEADTDAAYVITRNGVEKNVSVSRERFKDSGDLPPLNYEANVIDLGRFDAEGRPVTSLALSNCESLVESIISRTPRSTTQKQFLRMLRQLQTDAVAAGKGDLIWTIEDLRELARGSGLAKTTARDVVAAMTQNYLMASVGGYRLLRKGEV